MSNIRKYVIGVDCEVALVSMDETEARSHALEIFRDFIQSLKPEELEIKEIIYPSYEDLVEDAIDHNLIVHTTIFNNSYGERCYEIGIEDSEGHLLGMFQNDSLAEAVLEAMEWVYENE